MLTNMGTKATNNTEWINNKVLLYGVENYIEYYTGNRSTSWIGAEGEGMKVSRVRAHLGI